MSLISKHCGKSEAEPPPRPRCRTCTRALAAVPATAAAGLAWPWLAAGALSRGHAGLAWRAAPGRRHPNERVPGHPISRGNVPMRVSRPGARDPGCGRTAAVRRRRRCRQTRRRRRWIPATVVGTPFAASHPAPPTTPVRGPRTTPLQAPAAEPASTPMRRDSIWPDAASSRGRRRRSWRRRARPYPHRSRRRDRGHPSAAGTHRDGAVRQRAPETVPDLSTAG